MNEPTRCLYEATSHGRCFRPTMRPDGLCFYHNPEALAKRKPKRLSRKALEAENAKLRAALKAVGS